MTARRIFTAKEIREAVTLVQTKHVGIRFWPDGSMEIMPARKEPEPEPVDEKPKMVF